ncbi:DUF4175 domain-containing protein [Labedaea rhizosphaerae]|uniref:Uncharacterized protein n=1 Tax=Labedaea rhizosphaerae TaxID=598644 RepID=A0A4R6SCM2_LABRH|nr:DUF4175 domain-containing protein [Labedaea rhizosphaerae]TDP97404.1 hypothetical protein EV186_103368 [Labedaea rhizosphaerae]
MKTRLLVAVPVLIAVLAYCVLAAVGVAPWEVVPVLLIAVAAMGVVALVRAPNRRIR